MGPGEYGRQANSQMRGNRGSRRDSFLPESSLRTLKGHRDLIEPLPNLFRTTFEQANSQPPGEQWLRTRLAIFDMGSKQKRKEVLEEFLAYVQQSSVGSMQELFSHQAHLFFVRCTSWFAVTLPMFYELALQVKVFLAFLEFREQSFIRAFFESGVVTTFMNCLSVDYDCTDEVRCLVLVALHKLAANGRYHKELLCAEGLLSKVMDCMADGMQWETLKCAGRLLCEIFRTNPKYQPEVIESLQSLLAHQVPLAQRVGIQALISLLAGEREEIPSLLCKPVRYRQLVQLAVPLLDSADLRVAADAYCLLCRLLVTFNCDDLLVGFCKSHVARGDNVDEWLRLELDSQAAGAFDEKSSLHESGNKDTPFGGWWKISTEHLYKRISYELATHDKGKGVEDDPADVAKAVNRSSAAFCEAFRKEAGQILRWSLLHFVLKRCPQLCHQLVDEGLTETLLVSLLDIARPVQQGAALCELQRLQLMSPLASQIVTSVLVKPELISAQSLVEFMKIAKPNELERARYRLRNVWSSLHCIAHCHEARYGADEMALGQKLLEKEMEQSGITSSVKGFFLTDVAAAEEVKEGTVSNGIGDSTMKSTSDDAVHRAGKNTFDVRRALVTKPVGGRIDGENTRIEMGFVEDIPFGSSLSSLIFDPLDISADEESPLIQELRTIEGFGTFRAVSARFSWRRAGPAGLLSSAGLSHQSRKEEVHKSSHRPTLAHSRALILRPVPPRGVENLRPKQLMLQPLLLERSASALSSAATEVSLQCGSLQDFGDVAQALGSTEKASHMDSSKGLHNTSLAETSVGPEWSQERSLEFPSNAPSIEFTGGPSLTENSETLEHHHSHDDFFCGHCCSMHDIDEGPAARMIQKTPMVEVLEVPKLADAKDIDETLGIQKRIIKVARCTPHNCLVFDPLANERERHKVGKQVTALLNPTTKNLFAGISDAGKFPKKMLGSRTSHRKAPSKVPPLHYSYASGSRSARGPMSSQMPVEIEAPIAEDVNQRKHWFEYPSEGYQPVTTTALGSMWHRLDSEEPLLQDAGDRLKAYFPASARSA